MFNTETEMRRSINTLDAHQHFEITCPIVERATGRRAAVTLAGERSELLEQLHVVYEDGWAAVHGAIYDFTRRNTTPRIPMGANRTRFGY